MIPVKMPAATKKRAKEMQQGIYSPPPKPKK